MKKMFLSAVAIVVMSASAFAQNIPMDPSVRTGTLPNGMKFYIKKNVKPEKKVEMRLAIDAGSILEDEDQQGLAHFMEHMNFNGTKNFPGNKLVDALESIGIKFGQHLNAYTSFDETVYMLPVPLDKPGNLDIGLKVMEDWAFNALLTDKEINKERGVVLEELRLGLGADKRMMDKWLPKMMYNSAYAKRLPIGKKEILEKFNPDVLRRFHKDWYRPDLMALVVVGDINVDEIEQKIKANFGKYKNPASPRKRNVFEIPNHKETLVSIESDPDATGSSVQFVMKDTENYTPDLTVEDYNKSILDNVVSTMINNRYNDMVESNNPPFTFGYVYHGGSWGRTKEAFQGYAMTKEGGQLEALKVLLEEVERANRFGFTASELERAKTELLSSYEESYNNRDKTESGRLIGEYVRNFLEKESIPGIAWEYEQYKKELPKITLEQTNNVLKKYVKEDSRVIVITGPKKETIKYPTEADVLKVFSDLKMAKIEPYQEKESIKNLVKPFQSTGSIAKTETDSKLGTTTFTLSNGAKVTYKKTDFKDDEIMFSARSLGGTSLLSDSDVLKTQHAFAALTEAGVNGFTQNDVTRYLAGKQFSVNPTISSLFEGFTGRSTKKDFAAMMELLYAYFTGLNNDPASFNAFRTKQSAFLDNMLSNPQFYFMNEHMKYMNQKNPRFTNIIPLKEDWDNTDYNKAYNIYKEKFGNAGNFHFYFVGNIDEAELKQLATQYIASLPTKGTSTTFKDVGYRQLKGEIKKTYKKGKDPKSMVQITYSGEAPYNEKEDLALRALGEVVKIKLTEQLREEAGGVYTTSANGGMGRIPYSSYSFSMQFPCGPENADKLTKIALGELDKIIKKGPEQKDLNKYKEGELNDYKTRLKENNFWLAQISQPQLDGRDKYAFLNMESAFANLTTADLQNVAKKYLTKEKVIATLMPEDGWEKASKNEAAEMKAEVVK
ncbi:M16 family metallopeptidase [Chryseobacterium taihuense]|uniref:Zinc protease n=1 Tax=Chryseobacterium taihuense TaxID=1141221 RepID=A0ABY0R1P5_9FLAO|nr:insulinase family protein [Chryseobacterium taihuense]SDM26520.1 zinc protease [Chryseobacterium taihuense]